ncbi:MAG: 4-alpha-glucanotransferase [Ruminococcaceae bacterium]|nr:4-alpha-glucanotransferase [Oscillospiraceae bacterium]
MKRESGILLPITSLPTPYGIGCLSDDAYRFVDFLCAAGQSVWQILPTGHTSFGDSPYQAFSSFAYNPYLVDLQALIREGLLTEEECRAARLGGRAGAVDYAVQYERRYPLLRLAYERARTQAPTPEQTAFESEQAAWLDDYALFMAIKDAHHGAPLWEWEEPLRLRDPDALKRERERLACDIGFWQFVQFCAHRQWQALRSYANRQGIRILGDLPIYVSADSADVWVNPSLFCLDDTGTPTAVAGCPPDGFTPEGQLWGNPLYRWEEHRRTGYAFWIARLSHAFALFDAVRIDHFRGFDSYYSIPYGAKNAVGGHWEQGPGMELFRAVENVLGKREIIAEDLGYMTDSVRRLVKDSGFAGMKLLQFGFDPSDEGFSNEYLPHTYPENSVAYPGTHDNPTLRGWLDGLSAGEKAMLRDYLWDHHTPDSELCDSLLALLMRSPSRLCILPLQDLWGLDDSARINRPSTLGGNWTWRMPPDALSDATAWKLRRLSAVGGRLRR